MFGLFLVCVFGFRFLIEFVKERQAAYGPDLALSVGQVLSIPLLILGVAILARALRNGCSEPDSVEQAASEAQRRANRSAGPRSK